MQFPVVCAVIYMKKNMHLCTFIAVYNYLHDVSKVGQQPSPKGQFLTSWENQSIIIWQVR